MSTVSKPIHHLELPPSLNTQLDEFRRRVWTIKMIEAACVAVFAVVVAFLSVFVLDRLWDTPQTLRLGVFFAALGGCLIVPWYLHRWIWSQRRPDQLARLLGKKMLLGDHLLGIIELVRSDSEQARSRTLCEAAIVQVAEDARTKNFQTATPRTRHRLWSGLAIGAVALAAGLSLFVPAAASNAWARLLTPWNNTPRYTFAAVEALPTELVIAHGEPHQLRIALQEDSKWQPLQGEIQVGRQQAIAAQLKDGAYEFEIPPQIDDGPMKVRIGDSRQDLLIRPTLRPELTSVAANVRLPKYLQIDKPFERDVRGGSISLVKGSHATFSMTAGRNLLSASVNGQPVKSSGADIMGIPVTADESRELVIEWRDEFGLAGKEPFNLMVKAHDDEAPTLSCENLPRKRVVLDSEQLTFQVKARDDFGVRRIGMEWQGLDETLVEKRAEGERILAAGGSELAALDITGTFSAQSQGIEPQPISLRIFVEDYLPGRERVYSPEYVMYVLNAEQHAIWLTDQLSRWHRQSLEVRDRELQLYGVNKELRELTPDDLDKPESRERIERQAAAERANGRRLSSLTDSGTELIRQASRNPEFGVGHLEQWAEMLQILKDISDNRMPSVADLLKEASEAQKTASNQPANKAPTIGNVRDIKSGQPAPIKEDKNAKPTAVPGITDVESSQQLADKNKKPEGKQEPKNPSSPSLKLPVTTLMDSGGPSSGKKPPQKKKMDEAIAEQEDLLAEFDRIADELNNILANLEGSTLVKRLKAASREQYKIAGKIGDQIDGAFGVATSRIEKPRRAVFTGLSGREELSSQNVSLIMDDMQAYFERRKMMKFKSTLEDMKDQDVVGSLRQLGDDLPKEHGLSIAQAEYWSDSLDRWAEDLVDPACAGQCPGCKSKGSLPPSIILAVLQVLEAEINLREDTRVAEQAKAALAEEEYGGEAHKLANTQKGLKAKIEDVEKRIRALKDGEQLFGKEIALMQRVAVVMQEAAEILASPETGSPAIAAETEVIELLLASKRIKPKSGGGGGSNPGGGGGGDTQDAAIALIGSGVNEKEVREDHGAQQATGETGSGLPEEFRAGLDEYFNQLERPSR